MRKRRTYLSRARERMYRWRLELSLRAIRGFASGASLLTAIRLSIDGVSCSEPAAALAHLVTATGFLVVPVYLAMMHLKDTEMHMVEDWKYVFEEDDNEREG